MGRVSDAKPRLLQATIDLIWRESYGSVTVDDICERAGVKKGSFYYFFKSKTELVLAALETHWMTKLKPELDRIFSPSVPPLDRLKGYFEFVHARQVELKKELGTVPGCPYCSVGSETSGCDPAICQKIQGIMRSISRYFESALRDAQAEGLIEKRDVAEQARAVGAYYSGALAQARIQNDPELLRGLFDGVMRILGATPAAV